MERTMVEERDLTLNDAKAADEAFLTSSMRDIQGIARWDDQTFSRTGPITHSLATRFADWFEADIDP
jgi:branched-chain amino acid aminotransferase